MNDKIYHVYDRHNKVVAHTLSDISLAEKFLNDEIDFEIHEVVVCNYDKQEEASY